MFKPWIGSEYESTRLLILGESAYSWWEGDELRNPSLEHSTEMVKWAVENRLEDNRFFGMVSRALARTQNPNRKCLETLWNRVAFTNYVSQTVGEGARNPPTPAMWEAAKREFLPGLSRLFDPIPRRVLVLGKTLWDKMPENTDVFLTDDVQGYQIGNQLVLCWATYHPAGGLSWRQLAAVIHFTYGQELTV